MPILALEDEVPTLFLKSNFRRGKIKRTTEYLIKWKGMNENGDRWKNTWEPAESVNAPELYAKFLKKREASDVPYYDIENGRLVHRTPY